MRRSQSSTVRAAPEHAQLLRNTHSARKSEDLPGSIQEDSSGTVKKLVAETPGAIGYLALSYLDDSVKAVKYEGVEANEENVVYGDLSGMGIRAHVHERRAKRCS